MDALLTRSQSTADAKTRAVIEVVATALEISPDELGPDTSLEDVFRRHTGGSLAEDAKGGLRTVRSTRRTAGRVG